MLRIEKACGWLVNLCIIAMGAGLDAVTAGRELVLECAKDILPERVTWVWPGRIPLGKLTVFAGDPGLGKSAVSIDVVARVTTNRPFSDNTLPEAGEAIILSAEDDPADTLRPRLDAAGADVNKVHVFRAVRYTDCSGRATEGGFNLTTDLLPLEKALKAHPDVRVIVIDPMSAYLGETDTHRNASMRGVLTPLGKLASDYDVAIIGIDHLNKSEKKAIYRVSGSIATVAASRSAWVFVKDDKGGDSRRLMLPIKNNLAKDQEGLASRIEEASSQSETAGTIPTIRVAWEEGSVRGNADDLLWEKPEQEEASALNEAMDWLKAYLLEPRESATLKADAERDGLSWSTVKRAKDKLRLKPRKDGDHWTWPALKETKPEE